MKELQHILVGIDFSPSSRAALREAIRWSAFDNAAVTAFHVMEQSAATQLGKALGLNEAELHDHVLQRLKEFLLDTDSTAKWVSPRVEIGHPYASLEAACKKLETDLLVLGSRGADHALNQVGVIAAKCLRKAPVDVLLVKESAVGPFKQVLACVDFSDTSARAVQRARQAAHHDQAKLDCVYVYRSAEALAADYGVLAAGALPALDTDSGANWQKELNDFVTPLMLNGRAVKTHNVVVEANNVRDAIRNHIEATHAGLVVLGTRGKTDLRTLVMGTTAERIVERAPCSILAVKPEYLVEGDE